MSDNNTDTTEDTNPEDEVSNALDTSDPTTADAADQPDHDDQGDDESGSGNKEAARYRRKLRQTETERDQLTQQVQALQRSEVERLAAAEQLKPAALWAATQLPDLLGEDGTVDPDKVGAAIQSARDTLGLPPPRRNHVPNEGRTTPRPPRPTARDDMVNTVMGRDPVN